jgi:hypothetical protein
MATRKITAWIAVMLFSVTAHAALADMIFTTKD